MLNNQSREHHKIKINPEKRVKKECQKMLIQDEHKQAEILVEGD